MNLDNINLNLLVALDAILCSPTLTDAARSLNITQPALSIALRKLRIHFNDDIVVYKRSGAKRTRLGHALAPRVAEVLRISRDTLRMRDHFDPATSSTRFKIRTLSLLEVLLLPALARRIARVGPSIQISSLPFGYETPTAAFDHDLDVAIVRTGMVNKALESARLFTEAFVAVAWSESPVAGENLTVESYRSCRQASMDPALIRRSYSIPNHLDQLYDGVEIATIVSNLATLAHLLVGTDMIGLMPLRLALVSARTLPLRLLQLPFVLPPTEVFVQWHAYRSSGPAVSWLVEQVMKAGSEMDSDLLAHASSENLPAAMRATLTTSASEIDSNQQL